MDVVELDDDVGLLEAAASARHTARRASTFMMSVYMCVCVCELERERE